MQITKLTTVDAFVVVDLPDAAAATGVVRCARKILQDGATALARSITYSYASFGIATSGASAGINAEGDGRDDAVAAFVSELAPKVVDGSLTLAPAKGVTAADLAAWGATVDPHTDALAAGVVAAAATTVALDSALVAVEAGSPGADAVTAAFAAAGSDARTLPLAELLASGAAVAVLGSKPGVLDHENVGALGGATIVGSAGQIITARGLAVAGRNGATVLPDFVTAAGPLLAAAGEADVAGRVTEALTPVLTHSEGAYLGACYAAEDFLRTWAAELPFGRPLA
ncbi:MAG: hypothetical protein U0Q22_07155 [Acidimicrobiales bacterium]